MSDEVSQFLQQVGRLRDQQIEEDEVRARELEEYLAAKRERQARREERARSISPQKSSPANTPSPRSRGHSIRLSESLRLDSPITTADDARESSIEPDAKSDAMDYSSSPTKENESPAGAEDKRSGASTPPARSSTLSWQRRPTSRGSSRPLSMVAAQNATQRSLGSQEPASATETSFSKDQIAQALGSKDPSWFRQTADRGQGSAAYRRNQVEDEDRLDMASVKAQLPGMSATPSRESTPSQVSNTGSGRGGLASPLPLNPPGLDGPAEEALSVDELRRSPSGRSSPTRSNSPTKGMGGFVQSAMMKRSDSVKRWSVTSPPGLKRADSVASNRGNYDRTTPSIASRTQGSARADSTTPSPTKTTEQFGERPPSSESTPRAEPPISEPEDKSSKQGDEDANLPVSPSKTMDPRRWSPTKSSWLDSALNKPESPKPQAKSFAPSQPAWMVELNKNKAERASNPSGESGRPASVSHKHQVSIGGLMRSSPMGAGAKTNMTGLGGIYSPPTSATRPRFGHGAKPSVSRPVDEPESEREPSSLEESKLSEDASEVVSDTSVKSPEPEEPPARTSSEAAPIATKTKPETPPKKDFRSNLKPRAPEAGGGKSEQPEFKNALGNLRRAKTQNYVAPDELKSNILRGKAALNITGGPKKTERKDEFKEAILKKKDDFKKAQEEGKGITRNTASAADKPVPEGLARRAELGKSAVGSKPETAVEHKPTPRSTSTSSPKPTPGPKKVTSGTSSSPRSASGAQAPVQSPPLEKPVRASTEPDAPQTAPAPRALPSLVKETSAPGKLQQGRVGGGKLADRFNPALAGMLARGPPPMATEGGGRPSEPTASARAQSAGDSTEPTTGGPQLTHMTKSRARGPKRKAPKSAAPTSTPPASTTPASVAPVPVARSTEKPSPIDTSRASPRFKPPTRSSPAVSPERDDRFVLPSQRDSKNFDDNSNPTTPRDVQPPLSIQQQVAANAALRNRATPTRSGFSPAEGSEGFVRPLALRRQATSPERPSNGPPSPIKAQKTGGEASQQGSPKKLDVKRMSKFLDESPVAPADEPVKEPMKLTRQRTGSTSPVKASSRPLPEPGSWTPSRPDSDAGRIASPIPKSSSATSFSKAPSPKPKPKPSFDGPASGRSTPGPSAPSPKPKPSFDGPPSGPSTPTLQTRASARPLPIPPTQGPKTPPPVESPARSPTKQASELAVLLTDFFGPQRPRNDYKVDPAALLTNPPKLPAKVKTLGFQMFQISGDGKKLPVPAHNERVLFEQEMYVCAHEFGTESGRKVFEVYFWVGDGVAESTAEDALLFAQREARSLGGKLIKVRQGKETSELLQALGGTVITRRGSSNKYDSLAPSMLCGRRYLGQVAFDEVDFAASSLCAGFPYLITQGGKCYLWQGKGSNVDELSCARLVGMDLTLTGELIECEEGNEPASFWNIFESKTKPYSADHWRLKPNYSKYGSRLFCSDADSRQQMFEISPFSQSDLNSSSVYVLDAFFEIYIIVGSRAQSQFSSFRNALNFASEYAILAASIEDRPFVPVATVVLEGAPRDLKRVFRRWSDDRSPTLMSTPPVAAAGLKRGRSMRVVPLTQALLALKE